MSRGSAHCWRPEPTAPPAVGPPDGGQPTDETIVGISGSLRRQSFNTALLRHAAGLMPADSTLHVRTLHGIPLFNADDEAASGIPPVVAELKEAIAAADGVILATPEYNNSIPGVFKNGIDWLSRPPSDIKRVFGGKPIAIMGASAGAFGTVLSQAAWLPVMRTLGVACGREVAWSCLAREASSIRMTPSSMKRWTGSCERSSLDSLRRYL